MSSRISNIIFALWLRKISSLGILQNLDSRSPLEAQANGKEVWLSKRPTSDRQCSDWQRTLSNDEALTDFYSIISHEDRIVPNTIRKLDTLLTYAHDSNSPLSHGGHIVQGDRKSFVLPRLASPPRF